MEGQSSRFSFGGEDAWLSFQKRPPTKTSEIQCIGISLGDTHGCDWGTFLGAFGSSVIPFPGKE